MDILTNSGIELNDEDKREWGETSIDFEMVPLLEEEYEFCARIWSQKRADNHNGQDYFYYYTGNKIYSRKILLHYHEQTGNLLLVTDEEKYFNQYHVCKNKDKGCYYTFYSKKLLDQHETLCCKEKVQIIQTEMGPNLKLIRKAEQAGLIPKVEYNKDFLFYDIESILPKSEVRTKKTKVVSTHTAVSIAVNR